METNSLYFPASFPVALSEGVGQFTEGMGLRLVIESSDIRGRYTTINVYKKDYSGEPVIRQGTGEALEISWGNKSGEGVSKVYGSSATIRFFAYEDFEFLDLFQSYAKNIFIEILKDEKYVIWRGFIEQDRWNEPLISPKYEVSFVAYDGLGLLKDVDFLQDNGSYYSGTLSFLEILSIILQKTGLQININTSVNYRQSGTTGDPLAVNFVDVSVFEDMNCYEVLEALLQDCRLFQRSGEWWLVNYANIVLNTGSIVFYQYNYSGTFLQTREVSLNMMDDGLSVFNGIDFLRPDGIPYSGNMNMQQIINEIFLKIIPRTGVAPIVNISCESLILGCIDVSVYIGMSCIEVLETLTPNSRVFAWGGNWYIAKNDELLTNIGYVKFYQFMGGVYLGTQEVNFNQTDAFWFEGIPELEIKQALKYLTVSQDFGYNPSIIKNGDFKSSASGFLTDWVAGGLTYSIRQLDSDNNKFVYLQSKQYPLGPAAMTAYLRQSIAINSSAGFLKISFSYALMGASGQAQMYVRIKLIAGATTYYAKIINDGSGNFEFIEGGGWVISCAQKLNGQSENIDSHPWNEIADHFIRRAIMIEGIPVSGIIYVELLPAWTDLATIAGPCFHSVTAELLNEDSEPFATSQELKVINKEENNFIPEEIELKHGDLPNLNNNSTIYKGGIINSSGIPSGSWVIDGLTPIYSYAELVGRLLANNLQRPQQSYNVTLSNIVLGLNLIMHDTNNPGKRFIENGITYNDTMQSYTGSYIEILPFALESFIVEVTTESSVSGTGSTGGSSSGSGVSSSGITTSQLDYIFSRTWMKTELVKDENGYLLINGEKIKAGDSDMINGYKLKAGKLTELISKIVTVEFSIPFPAGSLISEDVKIYRYIPYGDYFIIQSVLYHYPSPNWFNHLGFSLVIDDSEDLAGVIVKYEFKLVGSA